MPTTVLGISVPDCPTGFFPGNQEICHSFTANFIMQREAARLGIHNVPYIPFQEGSLQFVLAICNYIRMPVGMAIQPSDIIIMLQGGKYNHSMVAVTASEWFGVNNLGTFGLAFERSRIVPATLPNRRLISLQTLALGGTNFTTNTHILNRPDGVCNVLIYRN